MKHTVMVPIIKMMNMSMYLGRYPDPSKLGLIKPLCKPCIAMWEEG